MSLASDLCIQSIEVQDLRFILENGFLSIKATKFCGKTFSDCKVWNNGGKDYERMRRALDTFAFVDKLHFIYVDFTSQLFRMLMQAETKIRYVYIDCGKMLISVSEMLQFRRKFDTVIFSHQCFDPEIWNDSVITKLLPRISIWKTTFVDVGCVGSPMPITDMSMKALVSGEKVQKRFSICGVYNYITAREIAKTIEKLQKRDVDYLSWNLGILQRDQAADAHRFFGGDSEFHDGCYCKEGWAPRIYSVKIPHKSNTTIEFQIPR